ncbi:acyl-CoA synthetase [Rhodococcus sp. OK302]|uniref:acyl-CoA synthetase n=1 Tax=Rhodococcus sp. OK302 TaxID=1882769 RepID=UPI000B942185|nr:long-chain fatty acid--CoA ligase [Rhodococcus sp. OK302]OYD66649.1 acyl-CoA synthetase (AMP-forming)/AMP-acid ligase II [Rhodococcus sp. OK302]
MYFTQGLHRSVQREPDAIAVVDGDRQLTFAQLESRVSRLAGVFTSRGLEPGDRVGMLATNCLEYVEYAFACSWSSMVLSPLNNRWSLDELAFQIEDAGIRVLLVDGPRRAVAQQLRDRCPVLETVIVFGAEELHAGAVDYELALASQAPVSDTYADSDALAVLMYTGGTTGRPKGVMLSAGQILTSAMGVLASTGGPNLAGRYLHVAPLFHLAAFAGLVRSSVEGSTHILMGDFTVEKLVETIADKRVTQTVLVPTMVASMLEYSARAGLPIDSLRFITYGASPMPERLLHTLIERLPELRLHQGYGMTELAPAATVLRDEDHRNPEHPERLRSVGRAAPHAEVRIVDAFDTELSRGEIGEVIVRGNNVMTGYWNNPVETAKALRDGWMHTGDLGFMDQYGYVFLVDRLKDMIISGGENVYSAEVEAALSLHPGVSSCAVIGVPDDKWGERVHAVIVLTPETILSGEELRDFVGERIARYKAPRTVDFVDALPLSPVGKILKRTLRESYVS